MSVSQSLACGAVHGWAFRVLQTSYFLEFVGYLEGASVTGARTESQAPGLPCGQPVRESGSRTFQGSPADPE